MGDWNDLDGIKRRQQADAAGAAGMADGGGWLEDGGDARHVGHHFMALGVLAVGAYAYQHRDYLKRLANRWWNGCVPAFPGGAPAVAGGAGAGAANIPPIRRPLLPPTVQLKVKRVGGEPAVLGANLDDTVQEMISRIETQLGVAVQNLLFAGDILTLFRTESLARSRVRNGCTLVYTVRQADTAAAAAQGIAGRARDLVDEMSNPGASGSMVSRVAGPAQVAGRPDGPK